MESLEGRLLRLHRETPTTQEAQEVIDTFISCFGEEYVDVVRTEENFANIGLQYTPGDTDEEVLNKYYLHYGYRDIIIRFPQETVTNELGLSTEIYDLFVKIVISKEGRFASGPFYKKATFTEDQLFSGYIHSHAPRMLWSEQNIQAWSNVCLGSGPINDTIRQLRWQNDIQRWIGFIAELRQIVRHESLEGGPYFRIESIRGPSKVIDSCVVPAAKDYNDWIPLMKSYIRSGRLRIGFIDHTFCLGVPFVEWLIDFTEYAKAWGKANGRKIKLTETIIQNNKIFDVSSDNQRQLSRVTNLLGKPVIVFKGQTYLLKMVKNVQGQTRKLVSYKAAAGLLNATLNVLNYWYDADNNTTTPVYK